MISFPAIVVHGRAQAEAALQPGLPVLLLSAAGAAGFAGCLWWRALVAQARSAHPATPMQDALDCGAAPGHAMAALRVGQQLIVFASASPAYPAICGAAATLGARVLAARPPTLDLGERDAARHLDTWLRSQGNPG